MVPHHQASLLETGRNLQLPTHVCRGPSLPCLAQVVRLWKEMDQLSSKALC